MSSEQKSKINTENLEFWMTNLPESLLLIPIIHLAIPGSHDSTTYGINKKSKISPDAPKILQYLKFLGPILGRIISNWAITQCLNITEQLNCGIRYFDLRVATKEASDKFYFVHNLYSKNVTVVLDQIKTFLNTHPKEIILLDFQHFFKFNQNDHERLIYLISSTFGSKLVPHSHSMTHLTLEYMTRQYNYQVIVIYRSNYANCEHLLWPSACCPTPWPATLSIPKLINYLDNELKTRNNSMCFVSQCVLTPTLWFACRHLFSSLKMKCVLPLEKEKFSWLRRQTPGINGINIVISDFVDFNNYQFSREVIRLNEKL